MSYYRKLFRPLLFMLPPEFAHRSAIVTSKMFGRWQVVAKMLTGTIASYSELAIQDEALHFPNPLGLAAGWDKSGEALDLLSRLGFGAIEIGSVSAHASKGNPRPRLRRLPADRALVVNYGLPNHGARVVAGRLRRFRARQAARADSWVTKIGLNLVVTNDQQPPSMDRIIDDFVASAQFLAADSDYITLNLSCPNTRCGVDHLQDPTNVGRLLESLSPCLGSVPVHLKINPMLSASELEQLLQVAMPFDFVHGFHFNLCSGQPEWLKLKTRNAASMPGAVSGKPVRSFQLQCLKNLYRMLPPERFVLTSSGGISSARDAYERICAGASMVQIYTALIYEGPGEIREILDGLCEEMRRDGFGHISEAVGCKADLK